MKLKIQHMVLFLLAFLPCIVMGQVKFYLDAEVLDQFEQVVELRIVIENGQVEDFKPPKYFEGFKIVSGPNYQSNYSFVNGVESRLVKYVYKLKAFRTGKITIATLEAILDGKQHSAKSVTINFDKSVKEKSDKKERNKQKKSKPKKEKEEEQCKGCIYT